MSRKDKSCSRELARRVLHGATSLSFPECRKISVFRRIAGTVQERSCLLRGADNDGRREVQPPCRCDRSCLRNRSWSSAWRSLVGLRHPRWNRPAALLPVCRTPKPHLAENSARYFSVLRQSSSDRRRCMATTSASPAAERQTEWPRLSQPRPSTFSFPSCGPRSLAPRNRQPEKEMAAPGVNNAPTLPRTPIVRPTAVVRTQEESRMQLSDALAAALCFRL